MIIAFAAFGLFVGLPLETNASAIANASGRPAECSATFAQKKRTVWQLAKTPNVVPYCDLLARAQGLVSTDPAGAIDAANAAEKLFPGKAAPSVAIGRAEITRGNEKASLEAFERALKIDPRAADDPKSRDAYAWTLARTGKLKEAAQLYRVLVPQVALLPEELRGLVYLRASMAVMANTDDPKRGLDDAAAYLSEARKAIASGHADEALLVSALVFDRIGDPAKSRSLLAELARGGSLSADFSKAFASEPTERLALAALALEAESPAEAIARWNEYAASPGARFVDAAKKRVASLKSRGGKSKDTTPAKAPKPPKAPK